MLSSEQQRRAAAILGGCMNAKVLDEFWMSMDFYARISTQAVYREVDRHGIANGAHAVAQQNYFQAELRWAELILYFIRYVW